MNLGPCWLKNLRIFSTSSAAPAKAALEVLSSWELEGMAGFFPVVATEEHIVIYPILLKLVSFSFKFTGK